MKIFLYLILTVIVVIGSFVLSMHLSEDSGTEAMRQRGDSAIMVDVVRVQRRTLTENFTYSCTIEASETVIIVPKVTGIVREMYVKLGDPVSKGDLLVLVEDDEFVQRLNQAKANLQLAEAQRERSRIREDTTHNEFARVRQLKEQGLTTTQDLDTAAAEQAMASAEVNLATAEIARARAAFEEAQLDVDNTRIVSPLDGFVADRPVDPGALATPTTPMLVLVRTDPVHVVAHLPESDILIARPGLPVTISAVNGAITFEGRVTRVAPTLDVPTRTLVLEISVPNPDARLRPGMSADVVIRANQVENALVLPEEAVYLSADQTSVYVVRDAQVHAAPVTLGIQQDGLMQIEDGLQENDLVVVKGQFLLEEGRAVTFKEVPAAPVADS